MEKLVIVRGGGDLATGIIVKLYNCGFNILVLETENPAAIRRNVAFSEAVYEGEKTVEGVTCYLADNLEKAVENIEEGKLSMIVDPEGLSIEKLKPFALVDAILAKKNLGTAKDMADITIGIGPGFEAGNDVDFVIETKRGHNLGRIIEKGCAAPNTGIPGNIGGFTSERVIYSPAEGVLETKRNITDVVKKGDIIAIIHTEEGDVPVTATIDGIIRGMLRDNTTLKKNFKMADIDPRKEEYDNCFTVSDKARCIAGGVVEALLGKENRR